MKIHKPAHSSRAYYFTKLTVGRVCDRHGWRERRFSTDVCLVKCRSTFGAQQTPDLPRCDITNITKTVRHGAAPYASISVVGAQLMVFFLQACGKLHYPQILKVQRETSLLCCLCARFVRPAYSCHCICQSQLGLQHLSLDRRLFQQHLGRSKGGIGEGRKPFGKSRIKGRRPDPRYQWKAGQGSQRTGDEEDTGRR